MEGGTTMWDDLLPLIILHDRVRSIHHLVSTKLYSLVEYFVFPIKNTLRVEFDPPWEIDLFNWDIEKNCQKNSIFVLLILR